MPKTQMVMRLARKVELFGVFECFRVAVGRPENRSHLLPLRHSDAEGIQIFLGDPNERNSRRIKAEQLIHGVI